MGPGSDQFSPFLAMLLFLFVLASVELWCCQMSVLCSFFALDKISPRQAGDGDADRDDEEDEE